MSSVTFLGTTLQGSIMKDIMKSVPGIDEAMAFGELMKMVSKGKHLVKLWTLFHLFSCVCEVK